MSRRYAAFSTVSQPGLKARSLFTGAVFVVLEEGRLADEGARRLERAFRGQVGPSALGGDTPQEGVSGPTVCTVMPFVRRYAATSSRQCERSPTTVSRGFYRCRSPGYEMGRSRR